MKLVMTLLVSDEADLVELNLDYHLSQGVDFVLVTANRASGAIVETVDRYVERGVASLIREDAQTYAQAEWVTRMARLAATEHGADWVINCDPDEFYWPEGGNLKEVLSAIPEEFGALPVPVCHFLPRPSSEEGHFAERMTVRETRSLKPGLRAQFAKVAHRGNSEVEVGRGNHTVRGAGLDPVPAWRPILGLHFPLRSYAQYERKVLRDGEAVANNSERKVASGVWRERYEFYKAGGLPEDYASKVLDDDQVEAGVREGRLVIDERLKRFCEARGDSSVKVPTDKAPAAAANAERVEQLRTGMRRTICEMERDPPALEAKDLRARLEKSDHQRAKLRAGLDKSERRVAKQQGRLEVSEHRVAKLQRRLEKSEHRVAKLQRRLEKSEHRVAKLQRGLEKAKARGTKLSRETSGVGRMVRKAVSRLPKRARALVSAPRSWPAHGVDFVIVTPNRSKRVRASRTGRARTAGRNGGDPLRRPRRVRPARSASRRGKWG